MANRIDLSNILINFLKKARYERHIEEGTLEENQFYAVTDGNEKTEYGDLFGNIENQADLYNALYASRLFKMEMCNDVRGYDIVHKLYDRREFDLSKFTVVGNPVISEDGIASGISNGDRVTTINLPITVKNYCVTLKNYKYLGGQSVIFGTPNFLTMKQFALLFHANRILLFASANGADWDVANGTPSSVNFIKDTLYDINFVRENGNVYKVNVFDHSTSIESTVMSISSTEDIFNTPNKISLGSTAGSWTYYTSSIDLKDFSVTVDGTEVFNGLKDLTQYDTYTLPSSEVITIPYIPSVDGVKIVDVAYKPLVDQLYTETGVGNYIIIDETNKTFRLPLPDIYSQIENKTSFTLRKWED